jgi:DNA-binding NtrC family response regulator
LASQLFGHEKGSFTGAHARHIGVFEQASHGTLLLDEIAEMPMPLQVYLLRVLESGAITRVGGQESIATPVRVIAATNRDPLAAIASGHLREDLYYRLADIPLHLPPLRARGEDVILLANMFIDRLNVHYSRRKHLAVGTEPSLLRHSWPGNVRELRSAVQRAFLLDPGEAVRVRPTTAPAAVCKEDATSIMFTVGMTLAEIERRVLLKTLAHFDNDKTATAHALGVSVRTIHNQLARIAVENDGGDQGVAA